MNIHIPDKASSLVWLVLALQFATMGAAWAALREDAELFNRTVPNFSAVIVISILLTATAWIQSERLQQWTAAAVWVLGLTYIAVYEWITHQVVVNEVMPFHAAVFAFMCTGALGHRIFLGAMSTLGVAQYIVDPIQLEYLLVIIGSSLAAFYGARMAQKRHDAHVQEIKGAEAILTEARFRETLAQDILRALDHELRNPLAILETKLLVFESPKLAKELSGPIERMKHELNRIRENVAESYRLDNSPEQPKESGT